MVELHGEHAASFPMNNISDAALSGPLPLRDAYAAVERIVESSGSSFTVAMKLMGRRRRLAIFAVYAFARAVDDIADGDGTPREKQAALAEWRREVHRIFSGNPQSVVGTALAETVHVYGLPQQEFLLLIEGMEMDAAPLIAPPLDALLSYTRRAAGTIGRLSMPIFGAPPGPDSDEFALSLADALQLTNILRDVREDAEIGRLYLPKELLAEHGLAGLSPMEVADDQRTPKVCAALGELAAQKFADARARMPYLKRAHIRPALMMMGVYKGYLLRLQRANWALRGQPLRIGKRAKLAISLRYAIAPPQRL